MEVSLTQPRSRQGFVYGGGTVATLYLRCKGSDLPSLDIITFLTFPSKQMREGCVVPPVHVRRLHPPCTGNVDAQVRNPLCRLGPPGLPGECCRRIYAVTMKNIPITIGFGILTISQVVFGIVGVIVAAREGGK